MDSMDSALSPTTLKGLLYTVTGRLESALELPVLATTLEPGWGLGHCCMLNNCCACRQNAAASLASKNTCAWMKYVSN
eukprot:scaffold256029_cov15-Tisochrysis_lutea.AAC.1